MARPSKEFQTFRNLTDRLLAVSKEKVDKRIAAYKTERQKLPRSTRPGRNPKGYRKSSDDSTLKVVGNRRLGQRDDARHEREAAAIAKNGRRRNE
jgi:hypothetical protein